MFSFLDRFDRITGEILTLKIIEKNPGDEQAIPFYYYDIYKNDSDQPIGKISIRIGISTPTITEIWVMKLMNHIAGIIMP